MDKLEPLGLNANRWRFLSNPGAYVRASQATERPLRASSTARQFATAAEILARLNGSNGTQAQKGLLLADDVGLGKTTVAALVAWVVARAGNNRVRILAPNELMARRWASELDLHVHLLEICAPGLAADHRYIKRSTIALKQGRIQVDTHARAVYGETLDCDLLIVDEAHRAKGENSKFGQGLRRSARKAKRLLVLTATPFSIHIRELENMLRMVGGGGSLQAVRAYDSALNLLYRRARSAPSEEVGKQLAARALEAVRAIKPYVIRHAVDDLHRERRALGDFKILDRGDLPIEQAKEDVVEILVRTDRVLRLGNHSGGHKRVQTNDPRFHVGWTELRSQLGEVEVKANGSSAVAEQHRKRALTLLKSQHEHPKAQGVAEWVAGRVRQGEKVVVFCHHHATAQEVARSIHARLNEWLPRKYPDAEIWSRAWGRLLEQMIPQEEADSRSDEGTLRYVFLNWLSSPLIRGQIERWNEGPLRGSEAQLAQQLRRIKARGGRISVPRSALNLYRLLVRKESRSTLGVMRAAYSSGDSSRMPGGGPNACAVQAICDAPSDLMNEEEELFQHRGQADMALAIFNSPFGPEVMVATDRLSEGIDLHSYCRTVIHYELDPSPIRTIQRNGRLRRINGWSAALGKPIECGYPAFLGTRDERLVDIMQGRLAAFSLLLGGAHEVSVEEDGWDDRSDEEWRKGVLKVAKGKLSQLPRHLTVRRSGTG